MQPRQSKISHGMVVLLIKMMQNKQISREVSEGRQLRSPTHFGCNTNLTHGGKAKVDIERADKSDKRHADERDARRRRRRRGFIEGAR